LLLLDELKRTAHKMHIYCSNVIYDCYVQLLAKLQIDHPWDETPS